jgi:hypothetical protein
MNNVCWTDSSFSKILMLQNNKLFLYSYFAWHEISVQSPDVLWSAAQGLAQDLQLTPALPTVSSALLP